MGMTITEKILAAHSGRDTVVPGEIVNAKLDLIVCHDVTTPPAVAMLTFSVRAVLSVRGVVATLLATGGLFAAVTYGRRAIPPAPLAMPETAAGKGTPASIIDRLPPHTEAIEELPFDSSVSETTRTT